jgi:hypothetical protein
LTSSRTISMACQCSQTAWSSSRCILSGVTSPVCSASVHPLLARQVSDQPGDVLARLGCRLPAGEATGSDNSVAAAMQAPAHYPGAGPASAGPRRRRPAGYGPCRRRGRRRSPGRPPGSLRVAGGCSAQPCWGAWVLRSAPIRRLDHRVLPKPVRCRAAGWGAANGVERCPTDLSICQCVPLTCGFVRSRRSGVWSDQVDAEEVTGSIPVPPTAHKPCPIDGYSFRRS